MIGIIIEENVYNYGRPLSEKSFELGMVPTSSECSLRLTVP